MNFQRVGAISNAHVGATFEQKAAAALALEGMTVHAAFVLPVGIGDVKKAHRFDLGSRTPPVVIECKSHRWTTGGNVPSEADRPRIRSLPYSASSCSNHRTPSTQAEAAPNITSSS
jgi:hypothetical protein